MDCRPPGSSVHGIFPRQKSWRRLPFPSPEDLPDPGIERASPAWQSDSLVPEPPGKRIPIKEFCLSLCVSVALNAEAIDCSQEILPLSPTRRRDSQDSFCPYPSPSMPGKGLSFLLFTCSE